MVMEILESRQNDICILSINGRLDSNTSAELDKRILFSLDNGAKHIIMDCKQMEYITSAGLRIVVKTAKKMKSGDGRFVLCAMADYVREIFEIAGFDRFLPIVPTLDDALKIV